ncbi:hypothetical protein [Chondrinema litorale]|uniref:hypothetical protein n=1 Tax=Chondrinema litorale TaxID=2994555 RepID=UPI0025437131|nr:hypothetical protein [Chondrinema litorale]UZR98183.1 hypothetical protein OQ292_29740 [Chondrinema litorale]
MAKRNKSDLVGNLINKRKLMESAPVEKEDEPVSTVVVEEKPEPKVESKTEVKDKKTTTAKTTTKKPVAKKRGLGEVDSILNDLKEDKKQDKYSSIKIKTDLYNRVKKIARKEGIDRHGHLIDRVLTDFCDRYEGK